jgi:hypothetical protein
MNALILAAALLGQAPVQVTPGYVYTATTGRLTATGWVATGTVQIVYPPRYLVNGVLTSNPGIVQPPAALVSKSRRIAPPDIYRKARKTAVLALPAF